MTALVAPKTEGRIDPADILTVGEESVLSSIRGIVGGIRARGLEVQMEHIEAAMISIGATVSPETDLGGIRIFNLCGARLSVRPDSVIPGAVELRFVHGLK